MIEVEWSDRLMIGVDNIDSAHQRLFSIVRRLISMNDSPRNNQWICQEGIKYFKNYAAKHFAEEEEYMRSIHYSGYPMHKRLHDNLQYTTLPVLEKEVADAGFSSESVQHFLGICIAWLTGHIMIEDRAITGKVSNKWIYERPMNEIAKFERIVNDMMRMIFGLKSQTVSECYSGEDFGKALYYRMAYHRRASGRPVFVYLGFEERLLLETTSEMLGTPVKKLDKIVLSTVQELTPLIMKSIGEQMAYTEACQLDKENFITHELLLKTFEKGYPPYSLLFGTDAGYFVLCIRA